MPSRLLQGRSREGFRAIPAPRREENVPLPDYQTPQHPVTEGVLRELRSSARNHSNYQYEAHLEKALNVLARAAGPLNERISDYKKELSELIRKRETKNRETGGEVPPSTREIHIKNKLPELEETIADLTARLEKGMRSVVDQKANFQNEKDALIETVTQLEGRKRAYEDEKERIAEQHSEENDEAKEEPMEDEEAQGITLFNIFMQEYDKRKVEWEAENMYNRYSKNNDYATFRKIVYDARKGEDDREMPSAKYWFDSAGEPQNMYPGDRVGSDHSKDGDEEDDLIVAAENRDLRCPLSMALLENPVTSKKCPHSFEKVPFSEFLRNGKGRVQCPVSGCEQVCLPSSSLFIRSLSKPLRSYLHVWSMLTITIESCSC